MKVRTRYAPSPTGYMHIGNLRTAIFEYLLAKKYNGDFILRIEDTDQEREVEGAVDFIYNTLDLCGFKIDEGPNNEKGYGPYIQSKRKAIYKEYALKLVEMGKAYYCFCSEEELTAMREKADAFIALPGGWGTLEEITEVITLKQLGIHNKPIIFLNTNDFYEYFFLFISNIRKEGFVSKAYDGLYTVVNTVEEAMEYIKNYQAKDFSSKY